MKLRTLIEISVLETRPPILRSPESVERLAFCTASCSQVPELIEAVKLHIHKEQKKEAIESFSC